MRAMARWWSRLRSDPEPSGGANTEKMTREERIAAIAHLRGEAPEATRRVFSDDRIDAVPEQLLRKLRRKRSGGFRPKFGAIPNIAFEEVVELPDGGRIRMPNGRVFTDHPAPSWTPVYYDLTRDLLSPELSPATLHLPVEARARYQQGVRSTMPRDSTVMIDAGAYLGYRAISFYDGVEVESRTVLAIELDSRNYKVLEKNVEDNGLAGKVIPIKCALWDSDGEQELAQTSQRTGFSLKRLDESAASTRTKSTTMVPTRRLDSILAELGIDHVDFLNVQVNGAEIEVLRGLGDYLPHVRSLFVASYYHVDGRRMADEVVRFLKEQGCEIERVSAEGAVMARGAP